MTTIVSGTNRPGSITAEVIRCYREVLDKAGVKTAVLWPERIDLNRRTPALEAAEEELLIPAEKFVFVLPEYNGSFPGAVKTLIDMCRIPECFYGKKALLTGIADGRAGNLRGMEHFTGILNHMRVVVHPHKLPISVIRKLMNERGELTDEATLEVIRLQLEEFLAF